ncbi:hypothetical protein ACFQ3P_25740 [Paraburkholderia sabiae]|uniref:Uncharacterized protein n=1 Tax=Paraburkholderia sabiae TaxID=273251 RepID=A0ABU9QMD7_9BURK|nr:hypothetical protein [Paraburkholderia sabiae]WJZ77316.1 hypothetical protein QEN71_35175 [Paraburkholderia sabiae]CAD6547922.1 hypothetical protein LMG24235_04504 [Paraburkholderia sabiae]
MNTSSAHDDALRREYDAALAQLDDAYRQLEQALRHHPSDSSAVVDARQMYERARRGWLSSELALRGIAQDRNHT